MFRRRKKSDPQEAEQQVEEARRAIREVDERGGKVRASSSEIMSVVREIRDFQRQNNFAVAIRHALSGEDG